MSTQSQPRSGLFPGWIIVIVTAAVLLLAAGVRSAPGVFVTSIEEDLGWQRAVVSAAAAFGILVFGLASPFSGQLMDRFGPRRIVLIGLVVISISMGTSAMMTQLWQLNLLWGALSGIGTGLIGSVLGATVANRWFIEKRGLVTGLFGASTSAGQLLFIRALASLAENYGWRNASWVLAVLPLLFMIPVALLLKDNPSDAGVLPFGAPAGYTRASAAKPDASIMRRALVSPAFWLLALTFFVCGFTSNGLIGIHFIPYAVSCGYTPSQAANFMALMGLFNFAGTLASGWLTDRYDPRKLLFTYYALRGVSLLVLPQVTDPTGLTVFAVLFGLDYIATVPPTIKLCADSFGRQNVGTVYGWVFCAHQVGAAVASSLGGIAYDAFGNYLLAFTTAGFIGIAAALLALLINRTRAGAPATA
jgi:sugar phosphate permease